MEIKRHIENLTPEIIAMRRDFHQHPELGFQEFRTRDQVKHFLAKTGIPVKEMAKTGVVGLLEGDEPGRTILLRADMDALPVTEETGLAWQSEKKGVMHACGHDGHIAMLLGAAKVLSRLKSRISGQIKFVFQPNEEDAGAWLMIKEGVMQNPPVDAAFACHLWSQIDTGTIDIRPGPVMAASHYFSLTIKGKGGHAHRADFHLAFKVGNHLLSNDDAMAALVRAAAMEVTDAPNRVTGIINTMAGEDFSDFAAMVPAAFAFIGIKSTPKGIVFPHHHPKFDIDEAMLSKGTELYVRTALAYLAEA